MKVIKTLCILGLAASVAFISGCSATTEGDGGSLLASFSFSPASPSAGQTVQFTDTSTGAPTSWSWDFGDGGTSNAQNPTHAFTMTGSKTVTLTVVNGGESDSLSKPLNVVTPLAIIIDHSSAKLNDIPDNWINVAKQTLHIAYGHTSHGSQLTTGMTGLVGWKGNLYAWNFGGTGGALDLREWDYGVGFGSPDATTWAIDLGNPDRSAWATATRQYLNRHPEINVVIWSWCWQMVTDNPADIQLYLDLMNDLEVDFPAVKFVYMTGHVVEGQVWGEGTTWSHIHYMRAKQIRDYCLQHNKILYDFADIESWDPDGNWYGDKLVDEACNYDSNGDGATDRNWAIDWQNAHPGEWYNCESAHSQPLNANLKAYAAWHLWARLAGWDGN
jgi:PKD repeat protein